MKKIIISLFLLMFITTFTITLNVKTENKYFYSENGKGGFAIVSDKETNLYGMTHNYIIGETASADNLNTQEINVFTMKTDGVYSKLVNWAYHSSNSTYRRVTLDVLAKDYERTHPGWIVLGGINADQYAMEYKYASSNVPFFPQPFYPLTMEGERRFTYGLFGNTGPFVGITNEGLENPFVPASARAGYKLYIYDENDKLVKTFALNGFNKQASAGETTVWMSYEKVNKDIEEPFVCPLVNAEHIYLVENPEMQHVSNAPEYVYPGKNPEFAGFGKGVVSKVTTSCKVEQAQFAIETTNEEVISALNVGTKIIVQDSYTDERLNEVEFSAGYHTAQRLNDQDVEASPIHGTYDTKQYSRSIFGRKEDGTYVLLTASMKTGQYRGMNQDESNALLKELGVVEAYQQDGGGSVCAILRNSIGTFDIMNVPKDGSTRANFNGLLFVVRDPGYKVNVVNNTRNSIVVTKEENENTSKVRNMEITVSDLDGNMIKKEQMPGDTLEISGLKENTEYKVTYTFEMQNPKDETDFKQVSYSIFTKTKAFQMPSPGFKFERINKTSVVLVKKNAKQGDWFRDVKVTIDGLTYNMGSEKELKIKDLLGDTEYEVKITYNCVEPTTGNVYPGEETRKVKTLSYEIPEIVKFEVAREAKNRVSFNTEYTDPDGVVLVASIKYGSEETLVTIKNGMTTVTNLDLENNEYEFKFVVTYMAGSFADEVVSDTIVLGNKKIEPIEIISNITYECLGAHSNPLTYTEGEELVLFPALLDGYSFDGWFLNGEKIEKIDATKTGDLTLVARFTKILKTFNITYNTDALHENPGKFTEGDVITLKDAKKEGYTFKGWMLDGKQITELKDLTSDVTLTAEFEKIEAPTTKKGCGCKKNVASMMFAYISSIALVGIILRKRK